MRQALLKYLLLPGKFHSGISTYKIAVSISLICDKSVITQNLAFLSYWYRKEMFADALLTGYSVITQFAKTRRWRAVVLSLRP